MNQYQAALVVTCCVMAAGAGTIAYFAGHYSADAKQVEYYEVPLPWMSMRGTHEAYDLIRRQDLDDALAEIRQLRAEREKWQKGCRP